MDNNQPIPVDSIPVIKILPEGDFAALILEVFSMAAGDPRWSPFFKAFCKVVSQRLNEPMIASSLSVVLALSPETEWEADSVVAAMDCLYSLPEDQLLYFRPALLSLSETENPWTSVLSVQAQATIRFIDDRAAVWAPQHKFDTISQRCLQERVHTAEEMRPYLHELLCWLQDTNWPPYPACERQLARFPEAAIDAIGTTIEENRGDGAWILNMVKFLQRRVPRRLWEKVYPQMKELATEAVGDEVDYDLAEIAALWIVVFEDWKQRHEIS